MQKRTPCYPTSKGGCVGSPVEVAKIPSGGKSRAHQSSTKFLYGRINKTCAQAS